MKKCLSPIVIVIVLLNMLLHIYRLLFYFLQDYVFMCASPQMDRKDPFYCFLILLFNLFPLQFLHLHFCPLF